MSYRLSISRSTFEKFEAVQVDTGMLSLSLLPELGGKLNSLRDLRTGREWLWRNPRLSYRRVPHGVVYPGGRHRRLGRMLPNCRALRLSVAALGRRAHPGPRRALVAARRAGGRGRRRRGPPAHTLAGRRPAVYLRAHHQPGGRLGHYTTGIHCQQPRGCAAAVHLERAPAAGHRARHVLAAATFGEIQPRIEHPARSVRCGFRIALSARRGRGKTPFGVGRWPGLSRRAKGRARALGPGIDLSSLPDAAARIAAKLWSDPLDEGWAALRARDGELRMRWDAALLPQLGVWINLGAWAGAGGAPYYNLGLEPCIGAQDSLAEAVQRNLFGPPPPARCTRWGARRSTSSHKLSLKPVCAVKGCVIGKGMVQVVHSEDWIPRI